MREEEVTKSFMKTLQANAWEIISYDFPQSGTGVGLHPNNDVRGENQKNLGMLVPDIIAYKNETGLISENKDCFDMEDVRKLRKIRAGHYSESIERVFGRKPKRLLLGISFPFSKKDIETVHESKLDLDFVVCIREDGSYEIAQSNDDFVL